MSNAQFIPVLLCGALIACETVSEPEFEPELSARRVGNSEATKGPGLIGSWSLRSALINDVETFAGTEASATLTLRADETYSYAISGDVDHETCKEPATSCTANGTYTHNSYVITLTDEDGPDSGNYMFCGNRNKLLYLDGDVFLTFVRIRGTRRTR